MLQVRPDFLLREVAGERILVPVGEAALSLHGMICLSESGALLWEKLHEPCTMRTLVDALLAEYEVDRDTAAADVREFLGKLEQHGVLLSGADEAEQ